MDIILNNDPFPFFYLPGYEAINCFLIQYSAHTNVV